MFQNRIITRLFPCFFLLASIIISTSPSIAEPQSAPYLIGPEDILHIYVWNEEGLTQDVTVLPDGKLTFPLVGEIQAQGRTLMELKEAITQRLQDYVTAPEVTVIVREIHSRRIYAMGELTTPGPYQLVAGMTVIQALSAAGGFAEWADEKNILVIRREGEKEVQYKFNYREYISGKNLEQNILLKPNDTIVVP